MSIVHTYDGLRLLPHVFHLADLTIRLGWRPQESLRQNFVWRRRGHVLALGKNSGVFANLVVAQYPDWEMALRMIMPKAVIMGIEVLRRAGWTTQIPYVPTVAVSATEPVHQVDHFEVVPLPPRWFDLMTEGILSGEDVAPRQLAPAWALADLIKREGWCYCGLGPDDIYWDTVTNRDRKDWLAACAALGLGDLPMNPDFAGS